MDGIMEHVMDNILNIENEQSKVIAYISELEMRRIHLLNRVGSLNEDIVTNGVKEKLTNKIIHMEIKVGFVETFQTKGFKETRQSKCRHNNAGYCRMKTDCVFYHAEEVCEKFITTECSEPKLCSYRHPKECKYWLGDVQGCLRGQKCKYLHRIENKGKKIKNADLNVDINNTVQKNKDSVQNSDGAKKRKISQREDSDISKTLNQEEKDDLNNSDKIIEKNTDIEEVESLKDDIIFGLRKSGEQLEKDNKVLKEQLEKFKRVVTNMDKYIKDRE